MIQTMTSLATESGERHLPMPPVVFGILALVAFIVLLGITFAFRSFGSKH